jgi:hypothetical protein
VDFTVYADLSSRACLLINNPIMKKILALIMLLAFSAASFAQEPVPVQAKTKEELLKKSKNQKTTGFIMLGAGTAAVAGGSILFSQNFDPISGESNILEDGTLLIIAGGLSVIGGVFFLTASGNNKRAANAMTASFKMEKGLPYVQRGMGATYYPALSLKLNIR